MTQAISNLKKWLTFPFVFIVLLSCHKDKWENSPQTEKQFNLTGFTRIDAREKFNVTITKGNDFSVIAKGPSDDVNDLIMAVDNGWLRIKYSHHINNRPKIDIIITLPTLVSLELAGASTATVDGFQDAPIVIRMILSGASKATLTGSGINTNVEISGASELTVTGATDNLYGNISGASKLFAYGLQAAEVDINASGSSAAYVFVGNNLYATASGGSHIYYKGNPATKIIDVSGGGQVIKE